MKFKRRWSGLLSTLIMIATMLVIFIVAKNNTHTPVPAQQAGNVSSGAPAEFPGETAPENHAGNGGAHLVNRGRIPLLQQGVKPEQVTRALEVRSLKDVPGFEQEKLEAKVGDVISVHFTNATDPAHQMNHSFVLVKPGKEGEVMNAAQKAGLQYDFIPKTDDVLAASHLVKPGETATILFRAPSEPGNYPYLCVFPGHGKAMHGILKISKR